MTRIVAYTYEADVHCPGCTQKRFGWYKEPTVIAAGLEDGSIDEHGLSTYNIDGEGNEVRPVFSTDEHDFTHCGDCRAEL